VRPEWAELRPYQVAALEAVAERRVSRGIVAIATGGGKGHIAGHLTGALGTKRVLYVVHRDTLVEQLERHVRRVVGDWVGVEQGKRRAAPMDQTVIASVQTLAAGGDLRLSALLERGFDALVTDEAHHALAETYMRIQTAMGFLRRGDRSIVLDKKGHERHKEAEYVKVESPERVHVGLTATPRRGDGLGLHNVFDDIVYQKDLKSLIREGWLVPIVPYTIQTATSLDGVGVVGGDYVEGQLGRAINNADRHAAVFDGWQKAARGLRTLVFCATIDHAEAMAAHWREHGIDAHCTHGRMPKDDQRSTLRWFNDVPGAVLMSCQLIGEGVDLPAVEAVLMARPTRSSTVYAQAIGRGTRLYSRARDYAESVRLGKAHCLVLDVTDSVKTVGKRAVNIGTHFGAPLPTAIADGVDIIDQVEQQQETAERAKVEAHDRKAELERVELIDSTSGLPKHFRLAWLQTGAGFLLPGPDGSIMRLSTDTLDRWIVETRGPGASDWNPTGIRNVDQARAVGEAEKDYRARYGAAVIFKDRAAEWRSRPPSDALLWRARKERIAVEEGDDAGTVSDKVSAAVAARGGVETIRERPSGPGPCPKCGAETKRRTSRFGAFYSCTKFPECRGSRQEAQAS
jgi:superfamily II DNA or RNA helicase